ncbi:MAG: peptidoglycan DD-metalloendopeptidase family protein [Elusimicrobia bacterium]|nr:peptidoglycan DD-metalloendopeptidase family protein [Elusimicrobiota bacterium]
MWLGLFAAGLSAATAWGGSVQSKQAELKRLQEDLRGVRLEIEQHKLQEKRIKREMDNLHLSAAQMRKRLKMLRVGQQASEKKGRGLQERMSVLETQLDYWKTVLAGSIQRLHRETLLSSDYYGTAGMWTRAFLSNTHLRHVRFTEQLKHAQQDAVQAKAAVEKEIQGLLRRSKQTEEQVEKNQAKLASQQVALAESARSIGAATHKLKELEESSQALSKLVNILNKNRDPYRAKGADKLPVPVNSLPWPVKGEVVASFGKHKHPELGTVVIQQGILVRAAASAPVRSIRDGEVVFAGEFRAYGQTVLVDHGSGFFSVYGLLGSLSKSKGEKVQKESVLGLAGNLDLEGRRVSGGQGVVYFELRQNGEAVNPEQWLTRP